MKLQILTDGNAFWKARCASAIKAAAEKQGANCVVSARLISLSEADALLVFGDMDNIPSTSARVYSLMTSMPEEVKSSGTFKKIFVPFRNPDSGSSAPDNITLSGMPVPLGSTEALTRDAARNYLVAGREQTIVLIAADGMSVGEAKALCQELPKAAGRSITFWIFSERGSERKSELEKTFANSKNVQITAYTEKIDIYIKAADLMITSPDVIALTEAAVPGIPSVIMQPDTPEYQPASRYFAGNDMAYLSFSPKDASKKAALLLNCPSVRERMINSQRRFTSRSSADLIVSEIMSDLS